MDQVLTAHHSKSLAERIRQWWQAFWSFRLQGLSLATAAGIALTAFWMGIVVGGRDQGMSTAPGPEVTKLSPFTDSARANYLVGRGLLEAGEQRLALEFIHQALLQEPGSAEYGTWQGLTYWQLGDREQERRSYQQSLARQPDYIPALLNLGHNLLESDKYRESLDQYEKVLRINPYEQTALYNRALCYHQLKDPIGEQKAYIEYLDQYQSDKWAYRAVEHLQHLGIFDYRISQIGNRKIVVNQRILLGPAVPARHLELERLARMVEKAPASVLHLVVYLHNDKIRGKAIAIELRQQLQAIMGKNIMIPIQVSWFDEPAALRTVDGKEREFAQGLLIFTQPLTIQRGKV
jgi:tetratricopeptide (TPR) repeat protein